MSTQLPPGTPPNKNRPTSWSPLGIIALFVFMIETVATTSLTIVSDKPFAESLVHFVIWFPAAIAAAFFAFLWLKREALFGPMDYDDQKLFAALLRVGDKMEQNVERSESTQLVAVESIKERMESLERRLEAPVATGTSTASSEEASKGTDRPEAGASRDAAWKDKSLWGDDPNKGKFGGSPIANERVLAATINPVAGKRSAACRVTISVRSTNPSKPLTGKVTFHLHPTFGRYTQYEVDSYNGVAQDSFTAWGVFTVGALADGGSTRLELDLADVKGGTQRFYEQ